MQPHRALYKDEIVTIIRPLTNIESHEAFPKHPYEHNFLISRPDNTQIPVSYKDLDITNIYIDATLTPNTRDSTSILFQGQHVTILRPMNSCSEYRKHGVDINKTGPGFIIKCDNDREAVAFYDELTIDGTSLKQTNNLYYQYQYEPLYNSFTVTFGYGPEGNPNFNWALLNDLVNDIGITLPSIKNNTWLVPDTITETDIENIILNHGMIPRDFRLLDYAFVFYDMSISA